MTNYNFISYWANKIKAVKLLGGKCIHCGESTLSKLTFHHIHGKEKTIGELLTSRWSKIEKELERCVLLCQNCHREQHTQQAEHSVRKQELLTFLKKNVCEKCGYSKNTGALVFHHKDKKEKQFGISDKSFTNKTLLTIIDKFAEEIEKCSVICANCHAEEHFNNEKFNRLLPEINARAKRFHEKQPKVDRDRMMELYHQGSSVKQIAHLLQCGDSTVSMALKSLGVKITVPITHSRTDITKLHEKGLLHTQIAYEIGCSLRTIYRVLGKQHNNG